MSRRPAAVSVLDDIKAAQDALTENARALARLSLRADDDATAAMLAILRDSTAMAVGRLERARLTVSTAARRASSTTIQDAERRMRAAAHHYVGSRQAWERGLRPGQHTPPSAGLKAAEAELYAAGRALPRSG